MKLENSFKVCLNKENDKLNCDSLFKNFFELCNNIKEE